jgi:Rieske Fe-S protein
MADHKQVNLTRRKAIRTLGWLVLIPVTGLWDIMVNRESSRNEKRIIRISLTDIPQGYSYHVDYWINRDADEFKVFSTKCTHLGCRIRPANGDQMICPCHGSVFSTKNGSVIKGPAEKSLEMLNFNIEENNLTIFIN